jgi:hypothetical protein
MGELREQVRARYAAGFTGASVTGTHEVTPGMYAAVVRAVKP